ncbi:MAG: FAD:protein FMN transferase [Anaerolineaceae bacterium]|nr:FAD:protein FMN transferase [Anaerolineaceae bacterium]
MQKIEFRAMGCQITAILDGDEPQAVQALEQVPGWFEEWEQVLSRFRSNSELMRLNASAGIPFKTGPVLWEVISAALHVAEWTGGFVTPTVLNSLEKAGYDRSFDQMQFARDKPSVFQGFEIDLFEAGEIEDGLWQNIALDEHDKLITLPRGCKIDLGGIAKGWAASRAALQLAPFGPALVDAGGDIGVSGPLCSGGSWIVEIADPFKMQSDLGLVALKNGGVATSGIDYRRWLKDGNWMHHIIDPRTNRPAETDLISVTVVSHDLTLAEAAAKMVMILGSEVGLSWLEDQVGINALIALQDGRLISSSGMHEYVVR